MKYKKEGEKTVVLNAINEFRELNINAQYEKWKNLF